MKNKKEAGALHLFMVNLLGAVIAFGFYGIYLSFPLTERVGFIWQLVLFCFILGTLILTMSNRILNHEEKESLPRLGVIYVLLGILFLLGNGLVYFGGKDYSPISYVGYFIMAASGLFLGLLIAELFLIFGGKIVDLK